MAVLLNDENTVKGLTCSTTKGRWDLRWHSSFFTKLGEHSDSNARVIGFCRVDLWRADGGLLKKLIVLQHALKHKEDERVTKET